jgi:hypothetical protein
MDETETAFLEHVFGIRPLNREDFGAVYAAMHVKYAIEKRWRDFRVVLTSIESGNKTNEEDLKNFSDWVEFFELNRYKVTRVLGPEDPLGLMHSYLVKTNSEAPCQFCSGLVERRKRLFKSRTEATAFAQHVYETYGEKMQSPYECSDGNGWHLTSKSHHLSMRPGRKRT